MKTLTLIIRLFLLTITSFGQTNFSIVDNELIWKFKFTGETTLTDGSFSNLIPKNIQKEKWEKVLPAYITTGMFSGDYRINKDSIGYTVTVKNITVYSQTLLTGNIYTTRDLYQITTKKNEFRTGDMWINALVILNATLYNKFKP